MIRLLSLLENIAVTLHLKVPYSLFELFSLNEVGQSVVEATLGHSHQLFQQNTTNTRLLHVSTITSRFKENALISVALIPSKIKIPKQEGKCVTSHGLTNCLPVTCVPKPSGS